MAYSNDFTLLINKIEGRLGLIPLTPHLPKEYNKEAWVDIIKEQSLVTFSRFYPYKIRYPVNSETTTKKNGIYYLNDEYLGDAKVLGILDIDWSDFGSDNLSLAQIGPYGYYSPGYYGSFPCALDQIMGYKMNADIASLFNLGIYIQYHAPNAFEIRGTGNLDLNLKKFVINVLVEHRDLSTISPTKMETFEQLAQADVATFLYKNLMHYDGLETVYANIDLKINELEQEASKRETIIEKLNDSYVSASNDNIPYMLTI